MKKKDSKKIIFMGTPEFAAHILETLIEEYEVVLVVTGTDKKIGRKQEIKYSAVKEIALKNNIKVFQPNSIKKNYEEITNTKADIIITCAYGKLIPSVLLNYFEYGAINVHASLLPKLRGGAPIHRAIIEGYDKTGITIMYMNDKMDEGNIISQEQVLIKDEYNVGILHDILYKTGASLLMKTLPSIFNKSNKSIKQNNNEATYGYVITREDELINFNKSAKEVYNQIRGLYPFPCGYAILNNEEVKICESAIGNDVKGKIGQITNIYKNGLGVKTKDKEIIITKIKPFGKRQMEIKDYINGKNKEDLLKEVFNEQ